jgi:DNA-binding XRE family transcriptional regulator
MQHKADLSFRLDFGPMAARRRQLNITQDALARATGVHRITIWRIETGKVAPDAEIIVAIARNLGVPVMSLFDIHEK